MPLFQLRPAGAGSSSRPDAARSSPWLLGCLAVVAGLGIGRFATLGDDTAPATEAVSFPSSQAPTEKIAALQAAVAADPRDATAWRLLGTAYGERGEQTQDGELVVAAEEAFDRAEALAPDDPTIGVGRGLLALTNHRFLEAEELGIEATRRLPANPDALGVLVDAQIELGFYDAAAETLQRMLDVRPGLPALARTSYLRELHGDLAGATSVMRQAVVAGQASSYEVASVTALLGDLQRKAGDLDGARASYASALDLAPELVTARAGTARVRAAAGDVDGAIAALQDATADVPMPSLLLLLHDLQVASGDAGAAGTAELIREVAAGQEASGQVVDLEMSLFEADLAVNIDRAIELARRAQVERPDNVFIDDALAWALFRSGDIDAAIPYADEALRLGTAEPLVRYHAAEIALADGRRDQAAAHLTVALRDPWFSFQHHDRAVALAAELGVPATGAR